jgi:hypothetical protein
MAGPTTDESRIELPAWLPWATTACLAAVVACLVELWMIERARNQLLADQGQLARSEAQALGNQLEAERIISRREIEGLRPGAAPRARVRVALLTAPSPAGAAVGAVAWDAADGSGSVRIQGLGEPDPGRDLQLWLEGPGQALPLRCAVFHAQEGSSEAGVRIAPPSSADGARFLLIEGPRGGSRTLQEAKGGGSIVLASPLPAGSISR